ncbi:MAG TPA: GGDEF domain-containing protein, partial [Xanthobacteraceae bacterium]|nr:GGDEF domain-containing protein [Xanthobacteraceae bacterium]
TVFITAVLGALLIFAGIQNRDVRALKLWGAAYLIGAFGLALVMARDAVPDWLSINVANALVLFGFSLVWAGARIFGGRPVRSWLLAVAPALWLAASSAPAFYADINLRIIVASFLLAAIALVTAGEVRRGRAEPLMSRWPTVCTLVAYGGSMVARIVMTLVSPQHDQALMAGTSFALLAFGTLLFTVVLAFLLLNMTKERLELRHKTASLVDPLCGVPNRRAFLEGINGLRARQRPGQAPIAVMLFDLDRFKEINDRFGHGVGDLVLQVFATTATATLGPAVMFGRIGGEEFAAAQAACDAEAALALADRVRAEFAAAAAVYGEGDLVPTVSVGITLGHDPATPLNSLLAAADRALYAAKANGRNRVEIRTEAMPPPFLPKQGERRSWRAAGGTIVPT